MDSWDLLSCVLLQLLPPNTAQHITPVLSAVSPGLQGGFQSPDIPEEQPHCTGSITEAQPVQGSTGKGTSKGQTGGDKREERTGNYLAVFSTKTSFFLLSNELPL